MTGEELNDYLNLHRRPARASTVRWLGASPEYKAAMTSAAPGLEFSASGGGAVPAQPAAAAPASVAPMVPATPSTPGIDPKMSVFVARLSQEEAQQCYELLYTVRGTRIYQH